MCPRRGQQFPIMVSAPAGADRDIGQYGVWGGLV